MKENKNIPCELCGEDTEKRKRIWYFDKCICDECANKISKIIKAKYKNPFKIPEKIEYIRDYPIDKAILNDEFYDAIYMKNFSNEFAFEAGVAVVSGVTGYFFSKKIYDILITENISIILLILFSLLPILVIYVLFCYRKNKQNSMDSEIENYNKKCKFKTCK